MRATFVAPPVEDATKPLSTSAQESETILKREPEHPGGMPMRRLLHLMLAALLFAAGTATAARAQASNYPNRPIRMFVGFPPGGAADIVARMIANALSPRLGQPIIIENKPGTGGNAAGEAVAKADPDGYTLLHGPDNLFLINPSLYARMPFDPLKDLVPVASLVSNQLYLTVNNSVQANTLREFVDLAKRTKPPLFYGSIGNGSMHHIGMEMFKRHVGIELTHVPYRGGGPASVALLAGDIQTMFGGGSVMPMIKSGRIRALAVSGGKRSPVLPDVPTIQEVFPGYEVLIWHGMFAPAGTPKPILDRLRAEIAVVLQQPELRERLIASGAGEPYPTQPEEFQARIRADHAAFGKVIRDAGLRIE
jgi:tripartite-type tricarboxylate transporter receptor subunit TctC